MSRNSLSVVIMAVFLPAWSQTQELPESLGACISETDDARRLACYDREVPKIAAADVGVVQDRSPIEDAVSPQQRIPEEEFGLTAEMQRKNRNPDEELDEIRATILSISRRRSGARVFSLDNGQVWAEKSEERRLRLDSGDSVRIEAASLGSFKLFGSGKYSTRVSRIE
jgi:hypothetical protein